MQQRGGIKHVRPEVERNDTRFSELRLSCGEAHAAATPDNTAQTKDSSMIWSCTVTGMSGF